MKIKALIALIVFSATVSVNGQKISNVDFDDIKLQTQDSTSAYFYPVLLQKFLEFDPNLTEKEFSYIYYGNVFTEAYNPYGKSDTETTFLDLFRQEKYREALPEGKSTLKENPVNIKILFRMLICYHKLDEKETAKKYAKLYYGLLNAIYSSGDGKSPNTAYVVIKVSDEYSILGDLELENTSQQLLMTPSGPTDKLIINTKKQKKVKGRKKITELYFNVAKPFEFLSRQFKKTDE